MSLLPSEKTVGAPNTNQSKTWSDVGDPENLWIQRSSTIMKAMHAGTNDMDHSWPRIPGDLFSGELALGLRSDSWGIQTSLATAADIGSHHCTGT